MQLMFANGTRFAALLLAVIPFFSSPASFAEDGAPSPQFVEPRSPTSDPNSAFKTFVDGFVGASMRAYETPGVTLSVVRDGDVILKKGYGYADIETRTPVDPDRHLFRIMSTTKPITATAIMQLVEQGKIDLNADVNDYLTAFSIPKTFDEPIRLRDLLTHRAGFEDLNRGRFVIDPTRSPSIEERLITRMPKRVHAPGKVTTYSNYGFTLLGYIVQETSGESYFDYVENHIFKPLNMMNTTAREPFEDGRPRAMPDGLKSQIASIYAGGQNAWRKTPFEFASHVGPAASVSSTASDMAQFMLAHLGDGALGDARILQPETAKRMRTRPYLDRADGPDLTHGFQTRNFRGFDTIEHSGASLVAYADMVLIPEQDLGVFVAVNGGNSKAVSEISNAVLSYWISEGHASQAESFSQKEAAAFEGRYMGTRRSYSDFEKLLAAFIFASDVSFSEKSGLIIEGALFQKVGAGAFENPNSGRRILFDLDENGNAIRYYSSSGAGTHERMTWDTDPIILYAGFGAMGLFSLTALLGAWRRGAAGDVMSGRSGQMISLLTLVAAGIGLTVLASLGAMAVGMGTQMPFAYYALPIIPWRVLLQINITFVVVTALLVAGLYPAFFKTNFSAWRMLHYSLQTFAFAFLSIELFVWNSVGLW